MPITTIQATAEGMPKFDKAAIMAAAWEKWRWFRRTYATWQIARGIISGADFGSCLRMAWAQAKQAMADRIEKARIAALMQTPAGDQIRALETAMEQADYKPWRISARRTRADIAHQINSVLAAAR